MKLYSLMTSDTFNDITSTSGAISFRLHVLLTPVPQAGGTKCSLYYCNLLMLSYYRCTSTLYQA